MVSPNVNRVLQEARELTPVEREELIEQLKAQVVPGHPQTPEDKVAEALFRKGFIRKIPRKPTAEDIAHYHAWEPLKIPGKPVSQTIIEERR
jgi:hypothetical protein